MGSKIHQVSHINSYTTDAPDVSAAALYAKLAAGDKMNEATTMGGDSGFMRNPALIKQEAEAMMTNLVAARDASDSSSRYDETERIKATANAAFKAGHTRIALLGYILGIWQLRRSRTACPGFVSHVLASGQLNDAESKARLAKVTAWLDNETLPKETPTPCSADTDAPSPPPPPAAAESNTSAEKPAAPPSDIAVLLSLHLNVAASAVKLSEWKIAKAACEVVLDAEPANTKALYRLAKTLEGEGEVKRALATVTALLQCDAKNGEGRKLYEALRTRRAQEKDAFGNMFAEAKDKE